MIPIDAPASKRGGNSIDLNHGDTRLIVGEKLLLK